jgi:hypothetical protein
MSVIGTPVEFQDTNVSIGGSIDSMAKTATDLRQQSESKQDTLTTAIHLPRRTWELLRQVAFHRAEKGGGRASVSSLLVELVESKRNSLEKEIKK